MINFFLGKKKNKNKITKQTDKQKQKLKRIYSRIKSDTFDYMCDRPCVVPFDAYHR